MTAMTWDRRIAAAIPLVAVIAVALAPAAHSTSATPAGAEVTADALTAAPGLDRAGSTAYASPVQERSAAEAAVSHVPLPEGGNITGIRWEETGAGFSAAEIETVVEYNAFCQWLRAAHDGRASMEALRILDDVPLWPGFRDQPDLPLIREVVAEAHAGGGADLDAAVADCARSHEREADYARSRGEAPST